jgi:hypothetical protein
MIIFKRGPNNKKTLDLINDSPHRFRTGARRGFAINGRMLVADVITKMNKKPKGGRSYKIYRGLGGRKLKRARIHIASTPSEYPAVITGALRKSVDFKILGFSEMEFGAGNNRVKYAKPLEKRNKYLTRTVAATSNQFKINLNREIRKQLGLR